MPPCRLFFFPPSPPRHRRKKIPPKKQIGVAFTFRHWYCAAVFIQPKIVKEANNTYANN